LHGASAAILPFCYLSQLDTSLWCAHLSPGCFLLRRSPGASNLSRTVEASGW
jgi:hypothetical protein